MIQRLIRRTVALHQRTYYLDQTMLTRVVQWCPLVVIQTACSPTEDLVATTVHQNLLGSLAMTTGASSAKRCLTKPVSQSKGARALLRTAIHALQQLLQHVWIS